jgi:ABC-type transport system involved in cytochrome c biogenesis permease subunit
MILETVFMAAAVASWLVGGGLALKNRPTARVFLAAGLVFAAVLLGGLGLELGRPPLQTLRETRWWFAFFLAASALALQIKSDQRVLIFFAALTAGGFVAVDFIWPQGYRSTVLNPVLRSPFFIPHVTAYLLAYAILAIAGVLGYLQYRTGGKGEMEEDKAKASQLNRLVFIGLGFLILGLTSGAAWAEEAWGRFWGWDPKETWAFAGLVLYLIFIHLRFSPRPPRAALLIPPAAFLLLLFAWLAQAILPAAERSLHLYLL